MRLSKRQCDIIAGTILGDGYLDVLSGGKLVRLQVLHSEKQAAYVKWKFRELKQIVRTPPRQEIVVDRRYATRYRRWRFYTLSHPALEKYHQLFYRDHKKIIPDSLPRLLKSPLALAVWYMDDGKRRPDCRGVYLDTICFLRREQNILIDILQRNFRIASRLHWNGDGWHIYIPYPDSMRFRDIIEPHIIPSMRYKLPPRTPERLSRLKKR